MPELFERNVHCLLGLPFDAVDSEGAVRRIRDAVRTREPCFLSTPNINWVVGCLADTAFRNSVINSHLSIADGMPLVWIARFLGIPIRERVAGSGVFEKLRLDRTARMAVYFFGGPDGVAATACAKLNAESSGMTCVGFECPGFGTVEAMSSGETVAKINASGADFVIVALGAKKGQAWIERNRASLSAPVISHLGAVVDFVAGRVNRAPAWTQRAGLEWLWRIKEQPGLWKRYGADGLVLLRLIVTRVLPYAWFMLWHRPDPREVEAASVDAPDGGNEGLIHLRGAWTLANMAALRQYFAAAVRSGRDITVDLAGVSYMDSAVVGLLIMLHGECCSRGRRLALNGADAAVCRILRYSCADYLLRSGPVP